ncbi:MAG: putative Ig domain-containing protein [Planctomycetota bacterium]|nr:putative Ig domain-containing protein [Planctomycetota bacterium]
MTTTQVTPLGGRLTGLFAVLLCVSTVAWGGQPNLTYTAPPGWVDINNQPQPIVISTHAGDHADSNSLPPYSTNDTLYVDVAVKNIGDVAVAVAFFVRIEIDGQTPPNGLVSVPAGLAAGATYPIEDIKIGPLSRDFHGITLTIDTTNVVVESSEADNKYTRNFEVKYPTPYFTSGATSDAVAGSFWTYTMQAEPNVLVPDGYNAGGLPTWMSLDSTGILSGTPPLTQAAPWTDGNITLTATNADATGWMVLSVNVHAAPPVITNQPMRAAAVLNEPFRWTATTVGSPAIVTSSPSSVAGLTAGGATITGTPIRTGTVFFTITATNEGGTDIKSLEVDILGPPIITGDLSVKGDVGLPFSYQIAASADPFFFDVGRKEDGTSPLPPGLQINKSSGLIWGTPLPAGAGQTFTVPLFATGLGGAGTSTLIIGINDENKLKITSPLTIHAYEGLPFYYAIEVTDPPSDARIDDPITFYDVQKPVKYELIESIAPKYPNSLKEIGVNTRMVHRCRVPTLGGAGNIDVVHVFTGEIIGQPSGGAMSPTGVYTIGIKASYVDAAGVQQSVEQQLKIFVEGEIPHIIGADAKQGIQAIEGGMFSQTFTATVDPCIWYGNSMPFNGIPQAPGAMSLDGILAGTPATAGLYWHKIQATSDLRYVSGPPYAPYYHNSLLIDPFPYVPIGVRQVTIDNGPDDPNDVAPVVPMTFVTVYVGETMPNTQIGVGGMINVAWLQTDGTSYRTDTPNDPLIANPNYLTGLPNPGFESAAAGNRPLSRLGLIMDGDGVLGGTPRQAGTFYIVVRASTTQWVTAQRTGYGLCTLRVEHLDVQQPIITNPNAAIGKLDAEFVFPLEATADGGTGNFGYVWGCLDDYPLDTPPIVAMAEATVLTAAGDEAILVSPSVTLGAAPNTLSFMQFYSFYRVVSAGGSTVTNYDGMVLEISVNGGAWTDMLTAGGAFSSGPYAGSPVGDVNVAANPLMGRPAWTGPSGGLISTVVELPPSAENLPIQVRWRVGFGFAASGSFVYIDTVSITTGAPSTSPLDENFDGVFEPALPLNWTSTGATAWVTWRPPQLPYGLKLETEGDKVYIRGTVLTDSLTKPNNQQATAYDPYDGYSRSPYPGVIGPWTVRITCTLGPKMANTFIAPDTVNRYYFPLTMVFYDKAPTKPVIGAAPTAAAELVPIEYSVSATNSAQLIEVVKQGVRAGPWPAVLDPVRLHERGLPAGLTLGATVNSTALISGIPDKGNSEYWPLEVMKPKNHSLLFVARKPGPDGIINGNPVVGADDVVGFGIVTMRIYPAPPNIEPYMDTAPIFSFNSPKPLTVRNLGLSAQDTVAGHLNHVFYDPLLGALSTTGYQINGFQEGGGLNPGYWGNVSTGGRCGNSRELDTHWDRYIFAPYDCNRGLYYFGSSVPSGMSVRYSGATAGAVAGDLRQVERREMVATVLNAYGSDSRTVTVASLPVTITSIQEDVATVGKEYRYQIEATGNPQHFWADGVPAGLKVDSQTGVISGIPLVSSDENNPTNPQYHFEVLLSATNAYDTGTRFLNLVVAELPGAPKITSARVQPGVDGTPLSYQIEASNGPLTAYGVSGLPPEYNFDWVTGLITGAPSNFGNFDVIVTATNAIGTGGAIVHFQIAPAPPELTSASLPFGIVGEAYRFELTATGSSAIAYTVTGLPPGLRASGSTIQGLPTRRDDPPDNQLINNLSQPFTVTVLLSNPGGSKQYELRILIYEKPTYAGPAAYPTPPAEAVVGEYISIPIQYIGSPELLVVSVTPLPLGLSFDGQTLSGVPLRVGSTQLTLSATNICGPAFILDSIGTLDLTISPLRITSALLWPQPPLQGVVGNPLSYQIETNGHPNVYSALNLPPGMSLDNASGLISGVPMLAGSYIVPITASNGIGSASAVLYLIVAQGPTSPAITSPLIYGGALNQYLTYQITATNTTAATTYSATWNGQPLETIGLHLSQPTDQQYVPGLIYGFPNQAGTFPIALTASNGDPTTTGTATLMLGISLAPGAPAIISTLTGRAMEGIEYQYQILATNSPASYNAVVTAGNLTGLNVDQTTGFINVTPVAAAIGQNQITLTATNGAGTATAVLALEVLKGSPPIITSPGAWTGYVGKPFGYQIFAEFAESYGATDLPFGLDIDPDTGRIYGTPILPGDQTADISATNIYGSTHAPLAISIGIFPGAPEITSQITAECLSGDFLTYQITATNTPTQFEALPMPPATVLPNGLSVDGATGLLTWATDPLVWGSFQVIVAASNDVGMGTKLLTITIIPQKPQITSPSTWYGNEGVPLAPYQITATGIPPITYTATGLPPGLDLNGSAITGTPTTQGTYVVTIYANNVYTAPPASPTQAQVTFVIGPPLPPTITLNVTSPVISMVGVPLSPAITVTVTGSTPMTTTVTGLPPGVTYVVLADGSVVISGAPDATASGSYLVTITCTNSAGTVSQSFTINVIPVIPGVDSDNDGFPDDLEIFLGSNPLDPNSTPFGGKSATGEPFHMPKPKLAIKLNFAKPNNDTMNLTGTLPVPAGFTAPGKTIVLYVGGVITKVSLDRKGTFTSADKRTAVKLNAGKSSPVGKNAKYSMKLKGNFQDKLADEGLTNRTIKGETLKIEVIVLALEDQLFYQKTQFVVYTAKQGKTGSAK